MIRAGLAALVSHWARHPVQAAMLGLGLMLATALWSGVQAINAEARAAYDRASATLGPDALDRLRRADGAGPSLADFVALRRAGWPVSPVIEGRPAGPGGPRLIGVEPLTLPAAALPVDLIGAGRPLAEVLGPQGVVLAHPGAVAALAARGAAVRAEPGLPPDLALADIAVAARLLNRGEAIDRLVIAPGAVGPAPLPAGWRREPGSAPADLARLTDSFHLNLTAFGLLSFAVGLFIVHAAVGLAFESRRATLRTLRALGMPARVLAGLMLAELALAALVAGALGMGLGGAIAAALLPDVAATLRGLYGAEVPGTLSLRPDWWAAGLAMALAGTLTAAAGPLWQAVRMPPLAPARPREWARASARAARGQALAGAGLLAAAAGLLGAPGAGLWPAFAGIAALMLGAALVLPLALGAVLGRLAGAARGPLAQWFWADARQGVPGLSLALMALMLALAANLGVGTMVGSFRATFAGWLNQRLVAELYLTLPDAATAARALDLVAPQVEAVLPIWRAEAMLAGQPGQVHGVADHATYRDHWPLLSAVPGVWDALARGHGLLVNEQLARRAGLALGDAVDLPGGALPVLGVYSDYGNPRPQAMVAVEVLTARFADVPRLRYALRLPADRAADLAARLRADLALPDEAVVDQAAVKALSLAVFDRTFAVTAALNVLTLGVAGVALVSSLVTLSALRLGQLAPLWALGVARGRLARLEVARLLALAALTFALALPLGLALAWALLAVVNVQAFGWRLPMQVFLADWLRLLALALMAAGLAALWPARRLARSAPADLLRRFAGER